MEVTTSGDSLHTPPPPTYVPFDIIAENILCRLPVKSLFRFRCVCRSWSSLISKDTKFAIKHLRLSPKRQHLVTTSWEIAKELTVMSCPFDSRNLHSTFTSDQPTILDYSPIIPDFWDYGLIASCDGILCFAISDRLAVLYNPSIRKIKKLTNIVLPQVEGSTQYAFGYDPFNHNYKVIAVSWCDYHMDAKVRVDSYTLGTDYWKRIKDFPSKFQLIYCQIRGVFVNGTVNWLTHHYSYWNWAIVSLHLGKESYQEIPLPDYRNPTKLILEVTKDCLCLFSLERAKYFIDVWLMKEYGNKESWVKFICLPWCSSEPCFFSNLTKIVYTSDDDNHVLLAIREGSKSKWVVYDFKNNTIKSSKINEDFGVGMVNSEIYVESLMSP